MSGGIGDLYRSLFAAPDAATANDPVAASAPSLDHVTPGVIGDAYRAFIASGGDATQWDGSDSSVGTPVADEQLAQPIPPFFGHPVCVEAGEICYGNRPWTIPIDDMYAWAASCLESNKKCNAAVSEARSQPGNVTMFTPFKDGTVVVAPGGGQRPYIMQRNR
jgi:hypothetical protein